MGYALLAKRQVKSLSLKTDNRPRSKRKAFLIAEKISLCKSGVMGEVSMNKGSEVVKSWHCPQEGIYLRETARNEVREGVWFTLEWGRQS